MAPTSGEALARAPSLRKPNIPKRLVDEALAVVRKRPRGKKQPAKAPAVRKARKTVAPTGARSKKKKNTAAEDDDECTEDPDLDALADDEAEELAALLGDDDEDEPQDTARKTVRATKAVEDGDPEFVFVGDPIPDDEARAEFPKRYQRTAAPAKKTKRCRVAHIYLIIRETISGSLCR
jgi:hypothetical protein